VKLNADSKQQPASNSKHKVADRKLEEQEGSVRNFLKRCTGYYEKGENNNQAEGTQRHEENKNLLF
jgi:hypothetical protein